MLSQRERCTSKFHMNKLMNEFDDEITQKTLHCSQNMHKKIKYKKHNKAKGLFPLGSSYNAQHTTD